MASFTTRLPLVLCLLTVLPILCFAADIEFVTTELPWAVVDRPYSPPPLAARASGACPLGGVGFAVVSGGLPPGLDLSRLGYFSGTPLRTGTFEFAVRVSNGCTWTAHHFALTVTGAPILSISPTKISFRWKQGSPSPAAQVLRVSSTWPRQTYSVSSDAVWLRAIPEHGFTPRESSAMAEDFVSVSVDTKGLRAGKYSADLYVSGWEVVSAPVVHVELDVVDGPDEKGATLPNTMPNTRSKGTP